MKTIKNIINTIVAVRCIIIYPILENVMLNTEADIGRIALQVLCGIIMTGMLMTMVNVISKAIEHEIKEFKGI